MAEADDTTAGGVRVASFPRARKEPRSRAPRRAWGPAVASVAALLVAHALLGASQPTSALFVSMLLTGSAVVGLIFSPARYATVGMIAGALLIWVLGLTEATGPRDVALPALAVLMGAGAAWTSGYLVARRGRALERAWTALVWTSLVYCGWMFFRHVGAAFVGDPEQGVDQSFGSPTLSAVLFGLFALVGSSRVLHVFKQVETEGLARSQWLERLLADGLGGLLLAGLALTCLVLTGSLPGVLIALGVILLHAWWDLLAMFRGGAVSNVTLWLGRAVPFAALVIIVGGAFFAFVRDPSGVPHGADARMQRASVYTSAFLEKPALGHGFGSIPQVAAHRTTLANADAMLAPGGAQNVALDWLVQTGLVGTVLLFGALALMLAAIIRAIVTRSAPRTFPRLAVGASVFLALHGLTESSLDLPSITWLYALVMGLACGVAASGKRAGGTQQADTSE